MIGRHPLFKTRLRLDGPIPPAIEVSRTRLVVAGVMFAAAFSVIGLRLVDLTLLEQGMAPYKKHRAETAGAVMARADMTDRNGVLLATGLATASLFADPRVIPDPAKAAAKLVRILPDLKEATVAARLESDRSFIWLHRHLTPRQQYKVNRLGIPGLDFRREERRVYPIGSLAAHVLGTTDIDNRGLTGIERQFDAELRRRGSALQLSIDSRVQHVMEQELKRVMRRFRAIGAAGVVQDVTTGEVVAMVSLPTFDPNATGAVPTEAQFNRATLGVYEMGSTFKIFTIAMALESGRITLQSGYDASKPIRISRFVIRDYHGKKRWLSIPEIFIYSSNIGAAKMAMDIGITRQRGFLARLGMLRPAGIELPEVGMPILPGRWREVNAMTISYGHGLAVSPVQLVSGVSAMVNGGIFYQPTLLKVPDGRLPAGKRVISARTSERMRRLMRLVVTDGTGSKATAPGFLVGGKTGTAEKVSGRKYKSKALISSFVGAFPMHSPRYVVFAIVDEPTGNRSTKGYATGGWVAAPVVSKVIARIGPVLGIKQIDPASPEIERQMKVGIATERSGKRRLASF